MDNNQHHNSSFLIKIFIGLVATVLLLVPVACRETAPSESAAKETIIFADLNWNSAKIQNEIARFIVEKGYGYPTDAVFGGTLSLFQNLLDGEVHVTLEIWLPNQQEEWDRALSNKQVIPVGKSIKDNWQSAFIVPSYVIEGDPERGIDPVAPELKTVQDIRQHTEIFSDAVSEGKAVLVDCPIGWSCEEINTQMVDAYGLDDVLTLRKSADQDDLFNSLKTAYDNGEPWLGYLWAPTLHSSLELTRLEEPPYSDFCWFTTKACNYGPADITIAVHPSLVQRAPEVIEFLRKWDLTSETAAEAEAYMAKNGLTFNATAISSRQTKPSGLNGSLQRRQ